MKMGPAPASLQLDQVAVYGSSPCALARAESLELAPAQLHFLVGPNGAGKTSLLRGIAGLLRSEGKVKVGERPLRKMTWLDRASTLAYQPQGRPQGEGLKVRHFVASARGAQVSWLKGYEKSDYQIIDAAMQRCGVESLAERWLHTLSGGEAARVLLASTIASEADWLLLDEPAAFIDAAHGSELYEILADLVRQEGKSIIVVDHDLGRARTWADSAMLMDRGEIVLSGPADDVFLSDELEAAYATSFEHLQSSEGIWALVARRTSPRRSGP